jgi:hypothetical protein
MYKKSLLCVALLAALPSLWGQAALPEGPHGEPLSFVGMPLGELVRRLGPPQSVYAARGQEHWQDDVVFTYNEGDFYIYQDRVWQVGLKAAYGMRVGDIRAIALLVLGEHARDEGDYMLYSYPGRSWPVSLRVNFIDDKVSAIFLYRPDF